MGLDLKTLAASKKYTSEALQGEGSLKGQDGKSAYQIALDNGFVGSQEQWLESLKGKDGTNGEDGKNGENGKTYTPSIGTVQSGTQAQANVDIDEENLRAKFNFILPKGDQGIPGPQGPDGNPVGTIIAFMGTTPPSYYLKCDGSVFSISAYPILAQHINTQFGDYKYFGGDGTSTFAVPDLRGEFLRGTGTATRDNGSGGAVGEHQEPTAILNSASYDSGILAASPATGSYDLNLNQDNTYGNNSISLNKYSTTGTTVEKYSAYITTRPTNTSVLYCIKYQ